MKREINLFDVKSDQARKVIRAYEASTIKPTIKIKKTKFKQTRINFSWITPVLTHKDVPPLDIMSCILGASESSRLYRSLMLRPKPLCSSVFTGFYTFKDYGIFLISLKILDQDVETAVFDIGEVLFDMLTYPVTASELSKAILMIESEDYYSMETVDGMSRKYGLYFSESGDVKYFDKYLEKVKKVTANDILNVGSYLDPFKITISSITSSKKIDRILNHWLDSYCLSYVLASKIKTYKPVIFKPKKEIKLKTGKSKFYTLDKNSSFYSSTFTPTLSISIGFDGGSSFDHKNLTGVSLISSRLLICETENFKEIALKEFTDERASEISSFCTKNSAGINLTTLAPYTGDFLEILKSFILTPKFNFEIMEREKLKIKQYLKSLDDHPSVLARLEFIKNIFITIRMGELRHKNR